MGRHESRREPDEIKFVGILITDPDARAVRWLLRWWWLFPPLTLALWPVEPVLAVALTALSFLLGRGVREFAPPLLAPRFGMVMVPEKALSAWREAERAQRQVRACWPSLGPMADPADIGPALDRARYRLALLLYRRAELDRSLNDLRDATAGLARDAPLREEVHVRGAEIATRRAELSERIAEHIGAVRHLAELCGEHALLVRRTEQARDALRRADAAMAGPDPGDADALAEIAERTEAVLAAYRELSALPLPGAVAP